MAEQQSWRERNIANELLQSRKDAVLEELGQVQLKLEETLQRATAVEKKVMEAKGECTEKIRKERCCFWERLLRTNQSAKAKQDTDNCGFQAVINNINEKHERDMAQMRTKLSHQQSDLEEQRAQMKSVHAELERQKLHTQEQKQLHWRAVLAAKEKQSKLKDDMGYMRDWIDKMHEELEDEKVKAKGAAKKACRLNTVAERRLALLKELKGEVRNLRDVLAYESKARFSLEQMSATRLAIKREREIERHGGIGK